MKQQKIKNIRKLSNSEINYLDRYDIEVENTHNFFANDVLVHNCRLLTLVDPKTKTVTQFTRNGKQNDNFRSITKEFEKLFSIPNLEFSEPILIDGEVVSENFQSLMTQVNRKTQVNTSDATYWVFDYIPLKEFQEGFFNQTQSQRNIWLDDFFKIHPHFQVSKRLEYHLVDLDTAEGVEKYQDLMDQASNLGLEGVMIKSPDAPYECKRSKNWMKYKPNLTVDLIVTSVGIGTGRNSERLGQINCNGFHEGQFIEVSVGSGFSDQQRDSFWNQRDQLTDQIIEVKADCVSQNQDGTYSLRFPRFVRFRGDVIDGKI